MRTRLYVGFYTYNCSLKYIYIFVFFFKHHVHLFREKSWPFWIYTKSCCYTFFPGMLQIKVFCSCLASSLIFFLTFFSSRCWDGMRTRVFRWLLWLPRYVREIRKMDSKCLGKCERWRWRINYRPTTIIIPRMCTLRVLATSKTISNDAYWYGIH